MANLPSIRDPKQGIENWLTKKANVIDQDQRDLCIKLFIEQQDDFEDGDDIYEFISKRFARFIKWVFSNTIEIEY